MSVPIDLNSLSDEMRESLSNELTIDASPKTKFATSFKPQQKKMISAFDVDKNVAYIPFAHAKSKKLVSLPSVVYKTIDCPFVGELREAQKGVKTEAITILNKCGSVIISGFPGFGKTLTSIYLASKIKLQTIIFIGSLVLKDQWTESIMKVCPSASVSFVEPSKKDNDFSSDFIIVNALNVPKFGRNAFKSVGTVIVDEVHLVVSEVLSKSLFFVAPRYLIGLSATPYRNDGLDSLLTLFFSENRIVRKMFRKHTVYKITTGIRPDVEYDKNGKINWNSVIEYISNNSDRNNKIIDVIKKFKDRNFLILCKRTSQAKYIYSALKEQGESVDLFIESSKDFDRSVRILIGTIKKLGVGFDFPKLDALIAAVDLESYFIQYLGRVFRSPEGTEPIVFDFLDNNPVLKRHYKTREKVYKETGGEIQEYKM